MMIGCKERHKKISKAEWGPPCLNSWDRDALIPMMDDEVLIQNVTLTLKNCRRFSPPASTYEDALQLYAAELVKRLERKEAR